MTQKKQFNQPELKKCKETLDKVTLSFCGYPPCSGHGKKKKKE